jgi:outer membrane murein-binding lipoprotein Lpp
MRPRLLLFIAIPTVAAVALGGTSIVGSWRSAAADRRSETLASLSTKVDQLAFEVEAERDTIVWYIAEGLNGRAGQLSKHSTAGNQAASKGQLQIVQQQEHFADPWVKTVAASLAGFASGHPSDVQAAAKAVTTELHNLPNLRNLALRSQVPATTVLGDYGVLVSTLLNFDDQVALSSGDSQFISAAQAMTTIARAENEDGVQRALLMYGLTAGPLSSGMLDEYNSSLADQKADIADFGNFASKSQTVMFANALAASLDDRVVTDELTFSRDANRPANAGIIPEDWYGAMSDVINATQKFDEAMATSAVDRAGALRERAIVSAAVIGGIILLVLLFSVGLGVFVGRSMAEPRRPLNVGETMA